MGIAFLIVLAAITLLVVIGASGKRPYLPVLLLLVLLPLNGLVSQIVPNEQFGTAFGAVKDGLLFLAIIRGLAAGRISRVPAFIGVGMICLLLLVLGAGIMTPDATQSLYGFRNDYYPLLLLIAVPLTVSAEAAPKLVKTAAIVAQFAAVISITTWVRGVQWLYDTHVLPGATGDGFPFQYFVAYSTRPRAFSPYVSPNEMAVGVDLVLALIWCHEKWSVRRKLLISVPPVVAVALSQSRSGILGLALLFVTLAARALWKRYRQSVPSLFSVVVLLGAAATIVYLAGQSSAVDPSLRGHADSISTALPEVLAHPFGVGLGQVGPRAALYTDTPILIESFWLVVAVEAGILVFLLFVAFQLFALRRTLGRSLGAYTAVAAIGASLISQLVLPTLQDGPVSYQLWIAVAIGLVYANRDHSDSTTNELGIEAQPVVAPSLRLKKSSPVSYRSNGRYVR